jgi:hypothetical protein
MSEFKSDISLGDLVYLLTDEEQVIRMVTSIKFTIDGGILYYIAAGTTETQHYRKEISKNKNIEIALGLRSN